MRGPFLYVDETVIDWRRGDYRLFLEVVGVGLFESGSLALKHSWGIASKDYPGRLEWNIVGRMSVHNLVDNYKSHFYSPENIYSCGHIGHFIKSQITGNNGFKIKYEKAPNPFILPIDDYRYLKDMFPKLKEVTENGNDKRNYNRKQSVGRLLQAEFEKVRIPKKTIARVLDGSFWDIRNRFVFEAEESGLA